MSSNHDPVMGMLYWLFISLKILQLSASILQALQAAYNTHPLNHFFNITVIFPNLTTTTALPSTTEKSSSTQTLPSGVVSSTADRFTRTASTTTESVTTTAQPTTKAGLIQTTGSTTGSVNTTISASEISTPAISSSDQVLGYILRVIE